MFGETITDSDGSSHWQRPDRSTQFEKFESFKTALRDSHDKPIPWMEIEAKKASIDIGSNGPSVQANLDAIAELEKSVTPDVLASIAPQLEKMKGTQADLVKEWTTSNPLSSAPTGNQGLVAYDLQAPAKFLVPRATPLRNRTPRTTQGVGTTARFKQITGVSNAGVGGVADITPFFNSESVSTTFGAISLRRPATISYAAADQTILFMEQGLSDYVSMKAFYESQGYENLRQLSQTALLWATLVGEEKSLLYARGSGTGFEGAISAPTAVALSANQNVVGSQVGNSANIANLYCYVQANSGRGQSVNSTVASTATFAAVTGKTTTITWTDATGALGYTIYLGTATGIANCYFSGTSQTNSFVPSFTGGGTGGCPNTGAQPQAADTSADANTYDGFLSVLADPAKAGYVTRLNTTFSTSNPGVEYQTAFQNMYYNAGGTGQYALADPDVVWIYPTGRVALSDLLKTAASANYRLTIDDGSSGTGTHLGSIVTGIVNEVTGKMVDFEIHPYMPKGCSIVHSETLPIPDSQVSSTTEVRNVVDYTALEWPAIQMTWDISTYILGALVFYAPLWSGTVLGIGN